MRVENHIHIRHIMLYHYEKGWKAAQSFRDLNELFGEGTITDSAVRKWFARFKSGDTSLEDKEGRGRPSDFDDQALLTAVEEDESLTTRMLAADFNVDQSTIVRRLKKLGKVWKLAGWVPHELSDNNKADRVRIFTDLLQRNQQTPFLKNLVTGDESWLLFKNIKKKFAYRQVFRPKEFRKPSTVRRLCGMCGGTEAESSTGKSSQMAFVIGLTTRMNSNNGESWTKTASGNST